VSLPILSALVFLVGLVTMLASTSAAAAVEVKARVVKVTGGCRDLNKNGKVDPYENWRLPVEQRVEDLLSRMTLQEKIGQMSYPSISFDPEDRSVLVVTDGGIKITAETEVNNGAGFMMACHFPSAGSCAQNLNQVQSWAENTRLGIPMIFGIDPHPQTYKGTRIVGGDRSMALSATNNLETVRKVYDVWRKEMRASGIHLLLGPQTDLTTDPRGARNLDTPGEDAEWIYKMNQAIVRGFQGEELGRDSALLCPKHFPGIGCTRDGRDGHENFFPPKPPEGCVVGTPLTSTPETIKWHWKPFAGAIDAGTWAVMSPYYVFPEFIEKKPDRIRIVLEDWLRGELGFKGVICADWGAVTPYADIQGGCGTARVTREYDKWLQNKQTDEERIDGAIRRILTGKFKLGLFDNPYVDPVRAEEIVDCEEHRAVAKEAAHQCQVVLKNEGNLIPLPKDKKVLWADQYSPEKAGSLADDYDMAVVSVTGYNGINNRRYDGCNLEMFVDEVCTKRLKAIHKTGTPIVAIYHVRGNPFPIPWCAENAAAILFAPGAHWYGSRGPNGGGWPEILSGEYEPSGKLPVQIPRSTAQVWAQREDLPYDLGCTEDEMDRIARAIGRGEAPPTDLGDPLFEYGITGWGPSQVTDAASVPAPDAVSSMDLDVSTPSGSPPTANEASGMKTPANRRKQFTVRNKYLIIPIQDGVPYDDMDNDLRLYVDDVKVRDYRLNLAKSAETTDWYAFFTIEGYMGRQARVEVDNAYEQGFALVTQSDTIPGQEDFYREPWRPQLRFSQKVGWNNDTNGLVYFDGTYHLFFQHNPVGLVWGNMTWGHAVSTDLLHWEQQPNKIFRKTMARYDAFSGSAVIDKLNTAGFGANALVAVFTDTGTGGEALCYSTDNGKTFTYYGGNPVLIRKGRDPKVKWYAYDADDEPLNSTAAALGGHWVMCRFDLTSGAKAAFHTSTDLKHWTLQHLLGGPAGGGAWDSCLEFAELPVDGDKENTKWAIWAGNNYYRIGDFDGKTFTLIDDPPYDAEVVEGETSFTKYRVHYGNHLASQVFNNTPDGRKIKMLWLSYPTPGPPYNQHFNFPCELSLRTTEDGIRMFAKPIAEIANLRESTYALTAHSLPAGEPRSTAASGMLFDIRASFNVGDAERVVISANGLTITYDALRKTLNDCPLKPVDGEISIQAVVDNSLMDIAGNEGRILIHAWHGHSIAVDEFTITAYGGDAHLNSFEAHELRSTHQQANSPLPKR